MFLIIERKLECKYVFILFLKCIYWFNLFVGGEKRLVLLIINIYYKWLYVFGIRWKFIFV